MRTVLRPFYRVTIGFLILPEFKKQIYAGYWTNGGTLWGVLGGAGTRYLQATERKKSFIEIINLLNASNITYWADGGTLIGALRHKGCIPWDRDCDICVNQQDLKKILALVIRSNAYYVSKWLEYSNRIVVKDPEKADANCFFHVRRASDDLKVFDIFPMYLDNKVTPHFWKPFLSIYGINTELGFYRHASKFWREWAHGKLAYPVSFVDPLRGVDFYNTRIKVVNNSLTWLKIVYGKNVMTHKNNEDGFDNSDGELIKNFSPL